MNNNNNNNSFSMFLNAVLGLLFVGSLSLGYFFGNFGGISIEDLNAEYTLKDEVKFSDLSMDLQARYINKSNLEKKTILNPSVEKAFDEDGNPLEMLTEDADDLKDIVKSLQNRILYLERENIIIANEKEELNQVLTYEQNKKENEKKSLLSNNLEKINEAEQQHYRNISELTTKINELQRENIKLSQQITREKELVENKIQSVVLSKEKEKEEALLQKNEDLKNQISKISNVKKEKDAINTQLKTLLEQLRAQRENEAYKISQKDKDIRALQDKISNLISENNLILTNNSQSFIKIQKENSQKLEDYNKIIETHNTEKEKLKVNYDNALKNTKLKYEKFIIEDQKKIKEITQKLVDSHNNGADILEKSKLQFSKTQKESNQDLVKIKTTLSNEIHELMSKNGLLNDSILKYRNKETSLANKIIKQKLFIEGTKDKVLQLQDKIIALDKKERQVDAEVNEQINLNEEKHNKNYRALNEKTASLEMKLKSTAEQSMAKNTQLQVSLNSAYKDTAKVNEDLSGLKKQIVSLEKDKENLKLSEDEKLVQLKDSFIELQASVTVREVQYEEMINDLKNRLSTNSASKSNEKKKLIKLASVRCDNMNVGNFNVPDTCKSAIDDFLNKYNETHFFEIIPIVGTGGFGTLNLIKRKSTLNIANTEIDRLTGLANLGLGKHRAKEAGELIKEKFGDFAKISYAVNNIEARGKRGFVISAYK